MLNSREPDEPEEMRYDSSGSGLADEIEESIYSPWTATATAPDPTPSEDDR